jgi:carotenoid 1,2-hydratase
MPTLPLLVDHPILDASHQVSAPGGYEWWYFDAEDSTSDLRIVAIFLDGFVFHPGYLRTDARYRRNPTRNSPALPRDYPCAYFVVYQGQRILKQFMCQYAPGELRAKLDRADVVLASNQFHRGADGSLNIRLRGRPWELTWRGPKHLEEQTLAGEFIFKPMLAVQPMQRTFLSRDICGADLPGVDHKWAIVNPLCGVSGIIELFDPQGGGPKVIEFKGRGYHDHNYGTGPIGPGIKRWLWGRVLFEDSVCTFHYVKPKDGKCADEIHLVQADATGMREISVNRAEADWSHRSGWRLSYPDRFALDDVLVLSGPKLVDSSPFYLRVAYDALCHGKCGMAFCEIAYPHRLRWPVLGRMVEMSIERNG